LLSEEDLESHSTQPTLIAIEEMDHSVAAIFASVRSVLLRETVPPEEFPEDVAGVLAKYDEIVGIKLIRQQALDVVSVSTKSPHVSVRIDYPNGMHRDVGEAAQELVKAGLATIVQEDHLNAPINLFPLIDEIYKVRHEGTVVELAFGTTTASLKHEKMRRRASCLREEAYHKGGKAALKAPIEPYRLSVIWKLPLAEGFSSPELGLYSTTAIAGSSNPILTDAVIRKCMGASDYGHVESRIAHFILELKKKQKK